MPDETASDSWRLFHFCHTHFCFISLSILLISELEHFGFYSNFLVFPFLIFRQDWPDERRQGIMA